VPQIRIKDYASEARIFHARLFILTIVILILVSLLLGRLVYLQIGYYDHYATLSQKNRISILPITPVRGLILDRSGAVLAQNFLAYTLEIVPDQADDVSALLQELGKLIQLTPKDLKRFAHLRKQRPGFESLPLRHRLSELEAARFAVNRHRLRGADLRAHLQRHYPMGSLGVHLVGYVGRISDSDLKRIDRAVYRGMNYLGKLGVEASYEDILRGRAGYEQIETNAHGRRVRLLDRRKPHAGKNLYLNVDARLQAVAEQALGARRGAVVAMDPKTGGVLTFASTPTYDPNPFVNGIDEASYSLLRESPDKPLINRALAGRYAPGSTIKGFLGLAALESGRKASKRTFCPGYFTLRHSRHRYRCWRKSGHGSVDLQRAIVESCDVYFYDLAAELGVNKLYEFLTGFGFGRYTGIDLDGEKSGLIPSPEWKRRVHKQPWYPGETVITGIGQGYTLVTPLQLAHSLSFIANRGFGMQPRIVYAIEDRADKLIKPLKPTPSDLNPVKNKQYYEVVIKAMTDVVHGPAGTARRIGYNAKYRIAGKTGTSQVIGIKQDEVYIEKNIAERHRDHALFIAFAPVEDPRIAIAVIVENGGHGGSTAAPIARKVMDFYLQKILPQKTLGVIPSATPAVAKVKKGRLGRGLSGHKRQRSHAQN